MPVLSAGEFSGTQLNFLGCEILDFCEGGSLTPPWSVEYEKIECVSILHDLPIYRRQTGAESEGWGWQGEGGAGQSHCPLHAVNIYL